MPETDAILLSEIQRGSHKSFKTLYDRYWDFLFELVYSRVKVDEDARKIMQSLWVEVWERPQKILTDSNGACRGFLCKFLNYRILDYYRDLRTAEVSLDGVVENLELPETEYYEILDQYDVETILSMVEHVVQQMPETVQRVFKMRMNQRKTTSETAQELHLSEKTVRNSLSKALAEIRTRLTPFYNASKVAAIMTTLEMLAK